MKTEKNTISKNLPLWNIRLLIDKASTNGTDFFPSLQVLTSVVHYEFNGDFFIAQDILDITHYFNVNYIIELNIKSEDNKFDKALRGEGNGK